MGERSSSQKNSSAWISRTQEAETPLFQTRPFSSETSSTSTGVLQSKPSAFNFNFLNIPTHAPAQPGQIQQKELEKSEEQLENDTDKQIQSGDGTIPHQKSQDLETAIQTKSDDSESEEQQDRENVPLQTKLTVGQLGDLYEQEADNMAAQVMAMPDSAIQRQTESIQAAPVNTITRLVQRQIQNKDKIQTELGLQRTANGNSQASPSIESRLASSKGGGSGLSDSVRGFMEPRFGADFSAVRVHTDSSAVQMNKDLGAAAFAHGNDIYYGAGKSPGNDELTAHELTHTIQQTGGLRLNKEVRRQLDKKEAIAPKQFSISKYPLTTNKEQQQKPTTNELEQTSEPLQPKQLSNYPCIQNKSYIRRQPLLLSEVSPRIQGGWLDNLAKHGIQKLFDFKEAISLSAEYISEAIAKRVGAALKEAVIGLAVGLIGSVGILAVSTAVGAAIGSLAGGVGAAPGATAGLKIGITILEWLGLAFLIGWIANTLSQVAVTFAKFFTTVWNANGNHKVLDKGAREFADAVALLIASILEAIIALALAKGLPRVLAMLRETRLGRVIGQSRLLAWLRIKASAGPLKSNSLVIDSNAAIALDKASKGQPLQPGETALVNRLKQLGNVELRVADVTIGELKNGTVVLKDLPLSVQRTSSQYESLLQVLEVNKVGRAKGTADRTIVADAFFAQTEPGVIPRFATHDKGIYNNLLRISGTDPAKLGKPVPQAFPNGFDVTINGRTIRVIPLPN